MRERKITYSLTGKAKDQIFWAYVPFTRSKAEETALKNLEELRDEGHPRAAVFVDGRRVRSRDKRLSHGDLLQAFASGCDERLAKMRERMR